MPRKAEVARAGCISGHNRLADHLNKLKLRPSPNCQCGTDRQTAEHVVMHCLAPDKCQKHHDEQDREGLYREQCAPPEPNPDIQEPADPMLRYHHQCYCVSCYC